MGQADPMRYRRMASIAARDFCAWVSAAIETYWHSGNAGGKTEGAAFLFLALCRGWTRLDGRLLTREGEEPDAYSTEPHWITLPGLRDGQGWHHWVLGQSYDQMKDSSVAAYRRLLGRHPHQIGWIDKSKGTVKLIRVKPDGWESDDPATWSEITFISQEGMTEEDIKYVQGARIDSAHFDEIGKDAVRREVRSRARANQPLHIGHTATPEYQHEWAPLLKDFAGCFKVPCAGRVRIQSGVEDNRALSSKDLQERWDRLEGDPLREARWLGNHVSATIRCPFPAAPLNRMIDEAQPGRLEVIVVRSGPTSPDEPDYRDILPASAQVERWLGYERTHSYLGVIDPSRGIDDPAHNPCELEIWDWTDPMCVFRFGHRDGQGGYLDPDSLGILADIEGRKYGNARMFVFTTGGFGGDVIARLRKRKYPNIARDDRSTKPGWTGEEYGVCETVTSRSEGINAIIKGLNENSFLCYSVDMLRQWADVREAADGRVPAPLRKAGVRHHAESVVCGGHALHVIQTTPAPKVMLWRRENTMETILRREMGHPVRVRHGATGPGGAPEIMGTE